MTTNASEVQVATKQLPPSQIIMLHLVPGLLITIMYVVLAPFVTTRAAPASLALLLAFAFVGIPVELALMYWLSSGRGLLEGGRYREPLPWYQYLWLIPLLLVWAVLASGLSMPHSEWIRVSLFGWVPEHLLLTSFLERLPTYSSTSLVLVVVLSAILNVIGPIVEELYFRGYLLPRMESMGKWAPLINTVLFSLYHFWIPWENPLRIIALLPVIYAVWWKRNIYLSIWVHVLLNSIGTIGLIVLLAMP